jgi:hypothetical protein
MAWTLAAVLVLLWALGMVSATTMGGFIHFLLVAAAVVIVAHVVRVQRGGVGRSGVDGGEQVQGP